MRVPSRPSRRPLLRWLVPTTVAVVLAGGGSVAGLVSAQAGERLEPVTPAELLADVQRADVPGVSGTVVQTAELGLPSLPGMGGSRSSELSSLLAGTHELRVWSKGADKSRVALTGDLGESDVYRDGRTVWVWSNKDKTATRYLLPAHRGTAQRTPADTTTTPQQAAEAAIRAITPSTKVSTDGTATVAGRRAYELVLEPRQSGSLVGSVRLAVDGTTHVPLRVQVFARGAQDPAFSVGFTSFSAEAPADSVFAFTPPPGAKVTTKDLGDRGQLRKPDTASQGSDWSMTWGEKPGAVEKPVVSGTGWASVVVAKIPPQAVAGALAGAAGGQEQGSQQGSGGSQGSGRDSGGSGLVQALAALPQVSGDWGSGRLLRGTLFSAVLSDDGRVAVGAVPPETLYAALARR